MHVAIRADASDVIGAGHVARCLTLANALQTHHRAEVSFICREARGHLGDLIAQRGFRVQWLTGARRTDEPSWREDVDGTIATLAEAQDPVDWMIIDHYAYGREWEHAIRTMARRVMAIDDLANRDHDADLLLDQNLIAGMQDRYLGRMPVHCLQLLGPAYALLQPTYAELRRTARPRTGPVRRLFVFMSGADRHNITGMILDAFLQIGRPDIQLDVVVASNGHHADTLRERMQEHSNLHLHCGVPTLAPLMALADLAVGAAGATSWERLCLGLPTLAITLSDHQRPVAAELQRRGLVQWLGHYDGVDVPILRQALDDAFRSSNDGSWSRRCLDAVDGLGASRVCAALVEAGPE